MYMKLSLSLDSLVAICNVACRVGRGNCVWPSCNASTYRKYNAPNKAIVADGPQLVASASDVARFLCASWPSPHLKLLEESLGSNSRTPSLCMHDGLLNIAASFLCSPKGVFRMLLGFHVPVDKDTILTS